MGGSLFFVYNLLMRRKANISAHFYVSKAYGLKDLTLDELAEVLLRDEGLLPHVVRQSSDLRGTRQYWKNKGNSLQPQARFSRPACHLFLLPIARPICNGRTLTTSKIDDGNKIQRYLPPVVEIWDAD
jgi:hypothetical protein